MHEIQGTNVLHQVSEGRIFARRAGPDHGSPRQATMIFGVVAVPAGLDCERMHLGRLNTSLWIDVDTSARPQSRYGAGLAEHDASSLLTDLQFRASLLPDMVDLFARATALPKHDRGLRWVYVIGAAAGRLDAVPTDGLYEIAPEHVSRVSDDPFMGQPPSGILRKPLWGPQGRYGLTTSMEPSHYPKWLAQERQRQRAQRETGRAIMEPLFLPFAQLMHERYPEDRLFYTAEHEAGRSEYGDRVLRALMAADEALQSSLQDKGDAAPWRYANDHPKEHEAFVIGHARKALAVPPSTLPSAAEQHARARRRAHP